MTTNRAESWYASQQGRDDRSRERSAALLGPERGIFIQAMSLISDHFDAVLTAEGIDTLRDDLPFKRKVSLVHYGFNLLCSAWDEAMAGRYQTAADHLRSIEECPDFLTALEINPNLADEMTDTRRMKIETARKTIQRALNESKSGAGTDLLSQQQKLHRDLQPLSHISVQSLGQYLPVADIDAERRGVVKLGGAVSHLSLRLVAIHLATAALTLLTATLFAFLRVVRIEDELWKAALDMLAKHSDVLRRELEALRPATARSAQGVYFARSDEVI